MAVAVDGSEPSRRAVEWAADEAARRGVPLRVVHASLWERYEGEDDDFARARLAARRLASDFAAHASSRRPEVTVGTEVIGDETVPALLAAGSEAALLVMGSRGHGGFEGLLVGSVTLRVTSRADFPVVVVRGEEPPPPRGRVVLGVGTHEFPGPAAEFAAQQARARSAVLQVVHAWQPDVDFSGISVVLDPGRAQQRAQALLASVTAGLADTAPDTEVGADAVPGPAAPALLHAADAADLLVLGSRRRHGHLGAVTHALLHHARCPVAVVPLPR
ncbi:stress-inducible protein (plasmid) [Streptantibioticus cattleyicolor NRRL 8057 = DSM 46488]|uniref:Stress-inducible protein n=1 Tax=Streptantibioticus cattleyicolor (strain ATCC 35852 / DSM 46488 / JCM 4925 / NBRC 14057 / NRRL 8057) TaxID=1003195 RepID=F8JMW5_STREN|nr:stress-inducible protein [Streptantibioticus cattleyicolor NRRL 8057 = DSM 46488]CCB71719.1 putative stress-inducible protein [Streptantibioticus cattleyicolor NRRL 8057 = DSM 46488]